MGSTPLCLLLAELFDVGRWAPWTWFTALLPEFGQLMSRLGPEPLAFPTRPLSIAVHSQARGALRNTPQEKGDRVLSVLPSKTHSDLSFPLSPLPLLPTQPNPGRFKHKLDIAHLLSIPSMPAVVARLTR